MISKQYYDVFGFLLDHSGCVDNVVCCSVLANRWPKMKYETTKSFFRTQVQSIAPYEDCYSSLVSGLTKGNVGKLHCIVGWTMGWDSEPEVWPIFQSWNVAEILKLNFDQRKIWPRINFFAESTQALGPLCLGNVLILWPEVVHTPVVQLAALVDHPSPTRLLVLHIHSLVTRFFLQVGLDITISIYLYIMHLSVLDHFLFGDVGAERNGLATNGHLL